MEPTLPDTLIVRRLPEALTERDLNEIFQYFGAQSVKKEIPKGKQRNSTIIAKFSSHEDASFALTRLHQLQVMGKRIVVEYADFTILPNPFQRRSLSSNTCEKLHWTYPSANEKIVNNIAMTMLKNPTFYSKVLEVMRNMDLPPPFTEECYEPIDMMPSTGIDEVEMEELYKEDTEESELETEAKLSDKEVVPELTVRRKKLQKVKRPIKLATMSHKNFTTKVPTSNQPTFSEAFDQIELAASKKFEFKLHSGISEVQSFVSSEKECVEGFGTFAPPNVEHTENEQTLHQGDQGNDDGKCEFISKRKLRINKLQDEEMKLLPVFKNYSIGSPSSRLYLKNLAKSTTDSDLKHIYGNYVMWDSEEERNMFDIRLMTEGRMKGQAFITLPNVARATEAINETNGFMLNGKPIVVQFARSAPTNATT